MKKAFLLIFVSLFSFSQVNAESNLDVVSNDSEWLTLGWDSVEGADFYQIDYWTESWNYTEIEEFIFNTSHTFTDLDPSTTYYFSLTWKDEWENQVFKEDEFSITTSSDSIWSDNDSSTNNNEQEMSLFMVESSEMVWENEIELVFSNPLKDESHDDRKFKVEWVENPNDYFEVVDSYIKEDEDNILVLTLDWTPSIWTEYKVIVLSTKDINNQSIEYWVDSETVFEWIDASEIQVVEEDKEDEVELNAAWAEPSEETSNAWAEVDADTVNSNLINVADSNERLPQTWPTQTFIVLLSLLFWALIFYNRFKK